MAFNTPAKPRSKPTDCISNMQVNLQPESNQLKVTPATKQSMSMKNTAKRKVNHPMPANY